MTGAPAEAREEATLPVPAVPDLGRPLGDLPPCDPEELSGDAPFTVAGTRAFVVGAADRGVDEAWSHPCGLLRRLAVAVVSPGESAGSVGSVGSVESAGRAAAPEPLGARASPLGVERRLGVGGRLLLERIVVPPDVPAVLVEWAAPAGTVLELGWLVDRAPSGAPLRWRAEGRALVVADGTDEGSRPRVLFALSVPPRSIRVAPSDGGLTVRAALEVPPDGSIRLAASAPSPGDAARVRRTVTRAAVSLRGRAAALDRPAGLAVQTPDAGLDRSLARALRRLPSYHAEAPGVGRSVVAGYGPGPADCVRFDGPASVRTGLSLLAAGERDAARDVLRFLGRHQHPDGRVPRSCAMTGQLEYDDDAATTVLYLHLVARYLAWTGERRTVGAEWPRVERALARTLRDDRRPQGTGAVLVELRHAAADVGATATAHRLSALDATGMAPEAWPEPGATAPDPGCPDRALDAAGPVGWLVYDVLGASPDATRGRLALRPRVPAGWPTLAVRGLAVGDAAVSLDYRADEGRHRFLVQQDRGAAPLQLVLEPSLPGGRVAAVAVDGAPAQLDPVRSGDRWRVPVQLALDHARTVVVEMADAG